MNDLYHYNCKLIRVIDGDTVEISIDLGLSIFTVHKVRLYGINAPELNTVEGQSSKEYLEKLFTETSEWRILTYKDRSDKYGRYLGQIYPASGSVLDNLNSRMVQAKQAVIKYYDQIPTR